MLFRWTDVWGRTHEGGRGARWRCTPCAASPRIPTGSIPRGALHLVSTCCSARSMGRATSARAAPFPRPISSPGQLPENDAKVMDVPNTPLTRSAARLSAAFRGPPPSTPRMRRGSTRRIRGAPPLPCMGTTHMVITNAVKGDPDPIDTPPLFMANMAWNLTMNTGRRADTCRARSARTVNTRSDPRGGGRLPLRDGELRRPRAARHHVSRVLRRHLPPTGR